MRVIYSCCLLLSALLLVACQNNEIKRPAYLGQSQLRAVLSYENGQWIATDCTNATQQRFQLVDDNTNFPIEANYLLAKAKSKLFIDVLGDINTKPMAMNDGSFTVKQLNRLTIDTKKGCQEDDYNRVIVRSIGRNPLWVTSIAPKGMVLERMHQNPLVLPYVDERLPDGQMNFTTEANGQTIQLWVAPEQCIDEETGDVYSMRAILTINFQTFRGCGYLGKVAGVINY